jgi:hypothetical protein
MHSHVAVVTNKTINVRSEGGGGVQFAAHVWNMALLACNYEKGKAERVVGDPVLFSWRVI